MSRSLSEDFPQAWAEGCFDDCPEYYLLISTSDASLYRIPVDEFDSMFESYSGFDGEAVCKNYLRKIR